LSPYNLTFCPRKLKILLANSEHREKARIL
jgi:hypothetical protein